jgi:peptide/nickel transport system permease protein
MRNSWPVVLARRLVALAATVVIAPTLAFVVFNGLAGKLYESLPASAWDYVVKTFWHRDLGISGRFQEPMWDVIAWTLPVDLALVVGGMLLGMGLGLAGGLLAAAHSGRPLGRGLHGLSVFLLCCPPYWLAFMLLIFFAPGVGKVLQVPFLSKPNLGVHDPHSFVGWLHLLWMPCLLVALPLATQVFRMTLVSVRDVQGQEFLRTARAKGLSERRVLVRHILPVALTPIAALTAANVALVVTNVTLMEAAYNLPGLYGEIKNLSGIEDTDTMQALIIETTVLIVVANMLADLVHARLDPRVR